MNIIKTSLVAACAVASFQSVLLASDSLSSAFENGKIKGQLKSYYFAKSYDNNTAKDASIWVNGVTLGYKTGDFNGFSLGTTAQFASATSDDDDSNKYNGTMNTSGTVLSEMYLQYTNGKTTAKAGRQFFWTPIVGGSGSRFIRQSFEGYSLTNSSLDNTKIVAAFLTKFAERTDGAGEPGEFTSEGSRVGTDGTWTVYVKNNSISNLTLQAQYASKSEKTENAKDGHDILYIDGTYNFAGDLKPFIAAQYLATSYESAASEDSNAYGVKAGATISGLSAYIAYTSVSDDNNVAQGIGSGSIPLYTNGATVDAWSATRQGTDAYKIGLGYKIDKVALAAAYSSFDKPNKPKITETNLTVTYKATKNLTAQVQYSVLDNQDMVETDISTDLRTRLIYSF